MGKYLSLLSKHVEHDIGPDTDHSVPTSRSPAGRKRLHILYLLNDLLHQTKYHADGTATFSSLSGTLQPFLVDLFHISASEDMSKLGKRAQKLLKLWEEEGYYDNVFINKLRNAAALTSTAETVQDVAEQIRSSVPASPSKELPFIMPATHGDPSMPYYDLPAGNIMPHIIPNSAAPIRPDNVRALQFVAGPAERSLVDAMRVFLADVAKSEGSTHHQIEDGVLEDIDDLGQISYRDETDEILPGDSYYGWSRAFCEKMKDRRGGKSGRASRARSYSTSRSPSRSPHKRRRYSGSASSRSKSRLRSDSPSRASMSRSRNGYRRHSPAPQGISDKVRRSRSSSYSPRILATRADERDVSASRQSSQLTGQGEFSQRSAHLQSGSHQSGYVMESLPREGPFHLPPNSNPFPPPPLGSYDLPVPPPPPPNYFGPWPPPPPPNMNFAPSMSFQPPTFQPGGNFPPPPPGFSQNQLHSRGNIRR